MLPEPHARAGLELLTVHSTDPTATLSHDSSCLTAYIYLLSFPYMPWAAGPHTPGSLWAALPGHPAGHLPRYSSRPELAFSILLRVRPPLSTSPHVSADGPKTHNPLA